ncbi:2-phosphoxylose phosphatase 1 [Smittium culicis]|uniref:2-phosphoxylose phosphatase 1 n=2 Tax=Smittium culicis TaxID=133412 RepID=A0A1R1YM82_9FUNG|nr:2-phosphoxylose phosphatase 1 [Smittium culicis]
MNSKKLILNLLLLSSTFGLSIKDPRGVSRRSLFKESYNDIYNSYTEYSEIYNNCQANFIDADTYNPLENSELISVQMIMRHGDRAPVYFSKNDGDIWNFCKLSKYNSILRPITSAMINSTTDDVSIGSKVVIPSNESCKSGSLTEKGGLASLDLGKATRSVYVDKLGFLDRTLKNTDQIKIRTSSSTRTIQTAMFFLSGLYPITGNNSDVIFNTFYVPSGIENMVDNYSICLKTQFISDKIQESDEYLEYLSQNSDKISMMNSLYEAFDGSPQFTKTRFYYYDSLQPRICHNLPWPCNSEGKCVTDEYYQTFRAGVSWEQIYIKTMNKYSPELKLFLHGFFLSDLKRDLEELVRNNKNRKKCPKNKTPRFYLYSAHDNTINDVIFSLLGYIPQTFLPPFSSNIFLEVWKNKTSGKLSVRIIYNNSVLKVLGENGSSQPWCDFNSCDYDTFINFLAKVTITDPAAQCPI